MICKSLLLACLTKFPSRFSTPDSSQPAPVDLWHSHRLMRLLSHSTYNFTIKLRLSPSQPLRFDLPISLSPPHLEFVQPTPAAPELPLPLKLKSIQLINLLVGPNYRAPPRKQKSIESAQPVHSIYAVSSHLL